MYYIYITYIFIYTDKVCKHDIDKEMSDKLSLRCHGPQIFKAAVLMAVALSSSVKGEREEAVPAEDDLLLPLESQHLAIVAKDDLQASATGECCLFVGVHN